MDKKGELSEYLTSVEAAKVINVTQHHITLLCRRGELDCTKLGNRWVVKRESAYSYRGRK